MLACPWQSQIETAKPSSTRLVLPRVRSMQMAQTGGTTESLARSVWTVGVRSSRKRHIMQSAAAHPEWPGGRDPSGTRRPALMRRGYSGIHIRARSQRSTLTPVNGSSHTTSAGRTGARFGRRMKSRRSVITIR